MLGLQDYLVLKFSELNIHIFPLSIILIFLSLTCKTDVPDRLAISWVYNEMFYFMTTTPILIVVRGREGHGGACGGRPLLYREVVA